MSEKMTQTAHFDNPVWFDGKKINETLFCEEFLRDYPMITVNGAFFTVNGRVHDENRLKKVIYDRIKCYVTSGIAKKVANLLDVMRMECCTAKLSLYQDRIHVANGTYYLNGTFSPEKDFCRNRLPVAYNPDAPQPVTWLHFLSQLLEPEDILTLQEFMGYCFIPSTKGQKMLLLIGKGGKKRVYSSKYALSGNVVCSHCRNIYRRVVWYTGGEKPVVWRCVSRLTPGQECPARTVSEEDLHAAVASAVNMAYASRDEIIPVLKENIESVVGSDVDEEIEVIDNMIRKIQMDLLDAGKDEARIQEIRERIVALRERRQNVLMQAALRKDEIDRIKAMIRFIEEQTGEAEYSEVLVRSMIEKVIIHDDKIAVEFKSGLAIDVEA